MHDIFEIFTGTVAKKIKAKQSNDEHDQNEFYNSNFLMAMPDHILQKIFCSLDLEDKKNFSECCSRFNEIFSRRKNLEEMWLLLNVRITRQLVSSISRNYTGLIWNKAVTKYLWTHLAPNLTSLTFSRDEGLTPDLSSFLDALPYFANLKYLNLDICGNFMKKQKLLESEKRSVKLVEMKNLEHLEMSNELFTWLDGRHINFDATKKLKTLAVYRAFRSHNFERVRALILNQFNLKELFLLDLHAYVTSIFDLPLEVHSKLDEFKLTSSGQFNTKQFDNFSDFINGQPNLKHLEMNFNVNLEAAEKMKRFLLRKLNMPLKSQTMHVYDGENGRDLFRYHSATRFSYHSEQYSVEDLKQLVNEQPNIVTEELKIMISQPIDILPLITAKFSNLRSLCISDEDRIHNAQFHELGFIALNSLQKLESLKLRCIATEHLKSIMIPSLKCFNYLYLNENSADLIEFLSRHIQIQELHMFPSWWLRTSAYNDSDEMDTVSFALANLKDLSKMCIRGYSHASKDCWTTTTLLSSLIHKHAKPGFVFTSLSTEIMKRYGYDNEIVRKIDFKWQTVHIGESSLKSRLCKRRKVLE